MKYRKKPVVIEATQFDGHNDPVGVFRRDEDLTPYVVTVHGQRCYIEAGDWIIPEPDGIHFYPCKPDIFAATYEPVRYAASEPAKPAPDWCMACDGSGADDTEGGDCPACEGMGEVLKPAKPATEPVAFALGSTPSPFDDPPFYRVDKPAPEPVAVCKVCEGEGVVTIGNPPDVHTCPVCHGCRNVGCRACPERMTCRRTTTDDGLGPCPPCPACGGKGTQEVNP